MNSLFRISRKLRYNGQLSQNQIILKDKWSVIDKSFVGLINPSLINTILKVNDRNLVLCKKTVTESDETVTESDDYCIITNIMWLIYLYLLNDNYRTRSKLLSRDIETYDPLLEFIMEYLVNLASLNQELFYKDVWKLPLNIGVTNYLNLLFIV